MKIVHDKKALEAVKRKMMSRKIQARYEAHFTSNASDVRFTRVQFA